MQELPNITPLQIYEVLQSIPEYSSRNTNTMESMKKNAFSIFMHREIMNFSSEELNNINQLKHKNSSFLNLSSQKNDPLVFSALLKKGVELDKLEPHCKWLVENFTDMPLGIYEIIYKDHQKYFNAWNSHPEDRIPKVLDNLFNYLENNISAPNNNILEKFYEHFQDKMHVQFLQAIVRNVTNSPNTTATLVAKIKEMGNDLNEGSCISFLLPKQLHNDGSTNWDFTLTMQQLDALEKLFILGFSPHTDYLWCNQTFFAALTNSVEQEQKDRVLPYLLISMDNNNIEEDQKFIETLSNKPIYNVIKTTYLKTLFEKTIPDKEDIVIKKKLKI